MAKSALDLFKQAYKGTVKQVSMPKLHAVKGVSVRESKVIGPLADDADSLLAEAYKKKVSPITSQLTHQPTEKLSADVGNRWAGKDMVRPKINSAKLSVKKK